MDFHSLTEAVELFRSKDQAKRRQAVDIAAGLGSAGAVALLIKSIQDQSWSLREYSVGKIALLGDSAVAPLCRILKDGVWYARAAAAQSLGLIGNGSALIHLIPLTTDPNRSVADSAIQAAQSLIGKCGIKELCLLGAGLESEPRRRLLELALQTDREIFLGLEENLKSVPRPEQAGKERDDGSLATDLQSLRRDIRSLFRQGARVEYDEP
jgi:HEAT repeat protein